MIKAEILADSINPQGDRITTMKVTFPRIVLAEFNTHRMFSRNSASSRAIPFKKMVEMVRENPFIPIAWQKDHKGMQGREYLSEEGEISEVMMAKGMWLEARNKAVSVAKLLHGDIKQNGFPSVTKQLCNRLLEPFMWHTVIVTATEWKNFFKLRCPQYKLSTGDVYKSWKDVCKDTDTQEEIYAKDDLLTRLAYYNKGEAEIHISLLAEKMYDALNESTPKQLQAGEWHIPFGDNLEEELTKWVMEDCKSMNTCLSRPLDTCFCTDKLVPQCMLKIAVARCARISYQTFGDNPKIDYAADIKLHDMLASNGHASPFEHVAKAMTDREYLKYQRGQLGISTHFGNSESDNYVYAHLELDDEESGWCRNFKGFIQYRELLENER